MNEALQFVKGKDSSAAPLNNSQNQTNSTNSTNNSKYNKA